MVINLSSKPVFFGEERDTVTTDIKTIGIDQDSSRQMGT